MKELHISPTEIGDMSPLQQDTLVKTWNRLQKEAEKEQKKAERKKASRR